VKNLCWKSWAGPIGFAAVANRRERECDGGGGGGVELVKVVVKVVLKVVLGWCRWWCNGVEAVKVVVEVGSTVQAVSG
jgi:hypothetical protein